MTALITSQRYNWMGYNGTESKEENTALLRIDPDSKGSNYDYDHRQEVMADIKERLYLIKRDLDLIPEEELRSEEEARRQRREARKQREAEEQRARDEAMSRRQEEQARRRLEEEQRAEEQRQRQAEEEARRKQEEAEAAANAQRWRGMQDSDEDSDDEDERNKVLSNMPRSQDEINAAVKCFTNGTRVILAQRGQGYVSYLDGSSHSSIAVLEQYNNTHAAEAEKAVRGTNATVPDAAAFSTEELRESLEARNEARKNLDARRVENDPTYAARLRKAERDNLRTVPAEAGDEAALLAKVEEAKAHHEQVRTQYNVRAAASGHTIATAAASRGPEGGMPAEAEAEAPAASAPAEDVYPAEDPAHAAEVQDRAVAEPEAVAAVDEVPVKSASSSKKASSKKSSKTSSKRPTPKNQEEEYPTEEPVKRPSAMSRDEL